VATVGATREQQRATRTDLARGLASDLQREQEMRLQIATRLVDIELDERHVVRAGTGDQHVVDRSPQLVEEPGEPVEVRRVECGDAAFDLEAGALHPLGVACRDDDRGSLLVCPPGGLEADAGTPADHQQRLTGELGVAPHHAASVAKPGAWMATAWRLTSTLVGVAM
jgi:hypothetical protein